MWARLSPKGEGWGEGEGDAGQNRPGAPGWLRRFAATLRLADSPALRREAAQPTPDIPHQKDTRQTDKFKPGLDRGRVCPCRSFGSIAITVGVFGVAIFVFSPKVTPKIAVNLPPP